METKLLDKINSPSDLKGLSDKELTALSSEIREFLIDTISKTGGHLASNLGTVELTVALHSVFDSPKDKIIFDVGHQSYTHKVLTGRKDGFATLRKKGGMSGFPKPYESEHDAFVAGHSSNSVSAALGIARGMLLNGEDNYAVAVIGDGAFTGGEVYEALNNAGRSNARLIVILNHNDMSISKNVGAFARYLSTIRSKPGYLRFKRFVEVILNHTPLIGKPIKRWLESSKSMFKMILYRTTFFEAVGFNYFGPVDGHDITKLRQVLNRAKAINGPVLIQVETTKGKGYSFAEENPGAYHATSGFDVLNGGDDNADADCYSNACGKFLDEAADRNEKLCAITAAMKYGTGLQYFSQNHKERFFDVGIAEGHAVTFAGGLASMGYLPVFAVYSTFLQRGYDQVIHDLSIDRKHALLCIDRAGIVGEDGETHQGIFDVAYLSHIPNIKIYSPEGYDELRLCLEKAIDGDEGVVAVRYPRGKDKRNNPLAVSWGISYIEEKSDVLLVSYGRISSNCYKAYLSLKEKGVAVSLLKLTQVAPLPKEAISFALNYKKVFFAEEGVKIGGIGEQLSSALLENGFKGEFHIRAIDNQFVPHGDVDSLLSDLGLDEGSLEKFITQEM